MLDKFYLLYITKGSALTAHSTSHFGFPQGSLLGLQPYTAEAESGGPNIL